jgi:hypothetical protein
MHILASYFYPDSKKERERLWPETYYKSFCVALCLLPGEKPCENRQHATHCYECWEWTLVYLYWAAAEAILSNFKSSNQSYIIKVKPV